MKRLLLLSLFLIVLSATFVCGEDQEIRTWTTVPNSSGKVFRAEGYLKKVSEDGKSVVLVINDKEKIVEIKRLTQEDKEYIEEYRDKRVRKVQQRIRNGQRPKQTTQQQSVPPQEGGKSMDEEFRNSDQELQNQPPEKQEVVLPQEGEKFTFYDNELPISRPIFGVYLGETIEGLAQRIPVKKQRDPISSLAEEFLEGYDVLFSDEFVKRMWVITSQGRVKEIYIELQDDSLSNVRAIEEELKNKYKKDLYLFYDEQENGAKVSIHVDYTTHGSFIVYSYTQMDEIHKDVMSKYKASKAGGRL